MKVTGKFSTREVKVNGKVLKPDASQRIYNHSPDGFNWSYGGSGPAQLALALMMVAFDFRKRKLKPFEQLPFDYQKFKWEVIAQLPAEDFSIELHKTELRRLYATT